MKTKIFTSLIVSAFLLTLFASFASASGPFTLTSVTVPTSVSNNAGSFNVVFNITYTGALPSITVDFSGSAITQGTATFSGLSTLTLNQDETKQVTATVTFPAGQTVSIRGNINAVPSAGLSYTEDLPFIVTLTTPAPSEFKFCEFDSGVSGNPGNLKVSIKNIDVSGYGEDNEWLPFDEVEVEVRVENNGDDDVDNVNVEWGLYDKNTDDWVIEVDDVDEVDLNDGDEETMTFKFTIDEDMDEDLSDLEDGDNYVLYVRATGEVDNTNNDDSCSSDSEDISIVIERDFVVLSDLQIPDSISCGSETTLTGDIWNIGSRDQNEVSMKIVNSELKINQEFSVGDIDSFDKQSMELKLNIPENAKEKSYTFNIEVYDDNGDLFQSDFNDDESKYNAVVTVGSCNVVKTPTATLSAELISEQSKAGKQLIVKATLKNTGVESATYLLNAAGHGSWATLSSVDPKSLTLASGKTGEATFTFDVNKEVSGDQTFNIEVVSSNALVTTQPVSVTVEASKSSLSDIFGDSWYIWLIGALNVILVIVIIVIAVRVAKK